MTIDFDRTDYIGFAFEILGGMADEQRQDYQPEGWREYCGVFLVDDFENGDVPVAVEQELLDALGEVVAAAAKARDLVAAGDAAGLAALLRDLLGIDEIDGYNSRDDMEAEVRWAFDLAFEDQGVPNGLPLMVCEPVGDVRNPLLAMGFTVANSGCGVLFVS